MGTLPKDLCHARRDASELDTKAEVTSTCLRPETAHEKSLVSRDGDNGPQGSSLMF